MSKKERAKKAKKDATPAVDSRKDFDDFKKVIENLDADNDAFKAPATKKKPSGPPAGFLDRQKKATEKVVAPPEEEKIPESPAGADPDTPKEQREIIMPKNPKMTEKDFVAADSKDEVQQIMSD